LTNMLLTQGAVNLMEMRERLEKNKVNVEQNQVQPAAITAGDSSST
jgi:hypothetical protein